MKIKPLVGGTLGGLLAIVMISTGHTADTPQFWAALGLMLAYGINMVIW
jgi:hypothetical protein